MKSITLRPLLRVFVDSNIFAFRLSRDESYLGPEYVSTSKYEGFPNIIIEALTLSKPIISINYKSGLSEILNYGKGGVIIRNNYIKNISSQVLSFFKNKNSLKKKTLCAKKGLNKYSFNNYHSVSPFDRSIGNGFRVVYSANSDTSNYYDNYVINYNERNILSEDDVSDEVFNIYRQQFQYEK